MLKKLVKRRKHSLSLARKSFKNRDNIRRKQEAGNILRERAFSGQNRRVGNSAENMVPFFMDILLKKMLVSIRNIINKITLEGLYQNKVNSSLVFTFKRGLHDIRRRVGSEHLA